MGTYVYQRFDYDSSKIKRQDYVERLISAGWHEIDSSREYEEHAWPIHLDRLNTHRDPRIESFVLKRLATHTKLPQSGKEKK